MKQKFKHIITVAIIAFAIVRAITSTQPQNTNIGLLQSQWQHSQYNLNNGYEYFGNMVDKDLYTYAAIAYVNGTDPSTLNFEHPSLAKYLIGFGYLLTGNIMFTQYIFYTLLLLTTFLLSKKILPGYLSFIPLLLVVYDPLISEYSRYVHLEFIQTAFILSTLYVLTRSPLEKVRPKAGVCHDIIIGALVGAVMASKVFVTGILLLGFVLLIKLSRLPRLAKSKDSNDENKKNLISCLVFLISSAAIYLLSYSLTISNKGLLSLIEIHIQIIRFFKSYLPDYPWFEIWRILFLGQWRTWFGETQFQQVNQYWIAWPLGGVSLFLLINLEVKKLISTKVNKEYLKRLLNLLTYQPIKLILSWSFLYLLFQSTHVVFPNYLIQVLPLLYILTIVVFHKLLTYLRQSFSN